MFLPLNITEMIRKAMGWCPNAASLNNNGKIDMISYEGKLIDKIKNIGSREILSFLHLVFGIWLIITALMVLAKPQFFPWWFMEINIISSGILLVIGVSSLMIFFNFVKSANIHRILALVNIVLLIGFSLYLSQFLVSNEFTYSVFDKPYMGYSFGFVTLILFTLIIGIPSILTFFNKPTGEKKSGFLKVTSLILIIMFASLGAYYLYLDKQKDTMLAEYFGENGIYKLYRVQAGSASYYDDAHPYFLDSDGDTTGHHISEDTYKAIQFLQNKETGKVLAWWDYGLEIKAAGKEPVISYASEAIKTTIARPSSLYDKFEQNEKVADVSRFFTTDSEEVAKGIAGKYGANLVYISRERMNDLIQVMMFAVDPESMRKQNIKTLEEYSEKIKPTMAYKFNSGAELNYFDKIFENKDVIIYQLK
ncbi:MAG: hypothetical protein OIN90_14555 [Candidatus Methanoperedens sp.]|nr:hypothetical protein [Candidatus Methanoperedens sp.]